MGIEQPFYFVVFLNVYESEVSEIQLIAVHVSAVNQIAEDILVAGRLQQNVESAVLDEDFLGHGGSGEVTGQRIIVEEVYGHVGAVYPDGGISRSLCDVLMEVDVGDTQAVGGRQGKATGGAGEALYLVGDRQRQRGGKDGLAVGHVTALEVNVMLGDVGVALRHQPVAKPRNEVFPVGVSEKVAEHQRGEQMKAQRDDRHEGDESAQNDPDPFHDLTTHGQVLSFSHRSLHILFRIPAAYGYLMGEGTT